MTLCPLCKKGLKRPNSLFSDDYLQAFSCGTHVLLGDVNQAPWCRVRQLERVLLEVLPLAQHASCLHDAELADANDCCQWAAVAKSIEGLGIPPKETADAAKL